MICNMGGTADQLHHSLCSSLNAKSPLGVAVNSILNHDTRVRGDCQLRKPLVIYDMHFLT